MCLTRGSDRQDSRLKVCSRCSLARFFLWRKRLFFAFSTLSGRGGTYFPRKTTLLWGSAVVFDAGLWSAKVAAESVLSLQPGTFFCHGKHFPSHFLHFLVVEVRISRGIRHSYGGARLRLKRGSGRQKSWLKMYSRCSLARFCVTECTILRILCIFWSWRYVFPEEYDTPVGVRGYV